VPWARYDEYLARDLVARVDSAYRTRADRGHRGVAGLSMGGYGAVTLALRYPDVFAAAVSHSGVLAPLFAGPRPYAAPARWAPSVTRCARLYRGYWTTLPLASARHGGVVGARPARRAAGVRRERPRSSPRSSPTSGADDVSRQTAPSATRWPRWRAARLREWPGAHTWTTGGHQAAWPATHLA
jgi:pimeloyl-ACP methyl ester carboxylesterase